MRKACVFLVCACLVAGFCFSCSSKKSSSADPADAPIADFTGTPLSGTAPLDVTFTSTSTGQITSYSWQFGDGGTSSAANPVHRYNSDGLYTVSLKVTGPGGSNTKVRTDYIAVGDMPGPDVDFEGTPLTGEASLLVSFTDLTSGTNVHTWSWDFGDGGSSTDQNPDYTYDTPGTYSVTLTATDDNGTKSHSKQDYIEVTGGGAGTGVDPSGGSGGTISPGSTGDWESPYGATADRKHVYIYIPTSYNPTVLASPVVFLFNEEIGQWKDIADANAIILVDLNEYNDQSAYANKITYTVFPKLADEYNIDQARYHLAGWSAGGNLVVIMGSQNQDLFVSTMVFPGTGGSYAQPYLSSWTGHKIRLYYACGDQDTNYPYADVEYEANAWHNWYGYTTRCDKVVGCGHYINEDDHYKRQDAWNWVKDFHLQD